VVRRRAVRGGDGRRAISRRLAHARALFGRRVVVLDSARFQWEEGATRMAAETADQTRYWQLCRLVDAVVDELRRRIGPHYGVRELAAAYATADDWIRPLVLQEAAPEKTRVGIRDVFLVQDAAFHAYARGATDYRP
jgi:hypothetical protein